MNNNQKTKKQLIEELNKLQRKVKRLEKSGVDLKKPAGKKNSAVIKQTRKNLSEQGQNYRTLIEASLDAIYVMQDGKLVMVNPAWEKLFHYSYKSACSQNFNFMKIVAPSSKKMLESRMEECKKNLINEQRYEFQGITRFGLRILAINHVLQESISNFNFLIHGFRNFCASLIVLVFGRN